MCNPVKSIPVFIQSRVINTRGKSEIEKDKHSISFNFLTQEQYNDLTHQNKRARAHMCKVNKDGLVTRITRKDFFKEFILDDYFTPCQLEFDGVDDRIDRILDNVRFVDRVDNGDSLYYLLQSDQDSCIYDAKQHRFVERISHV